MNTLIQDPATAPWGLSLSGADFAKLKRGVRARDMDDRWVFLDMTDEEVEMELSKSREAANGETTNGATTNGTTTNGLTANQEHSTDEDLLDEDLSDEAATAEPTVDLDRGGNISIRRSWTNTELYRLAIKPREGAISPKIESITWEQIQGDPVSEEQAKIDVVLLCRSIAECDLAAAPDYDSTLFSAFPRSDGGNGQNGTH